MTSSIPETSEILALIVCTVSSLRNSYYPVLRGVIENIHLKALEEGGGLRASAVKLKYHPLYLLKEAYDIDKGNLTFHRQPVMQY